VYSSHCHVPLAEVFVYLAQVVILVAERAHLLVQSRHYYLALVVVFLQHWVSAEPSLIARLFRLGSAFVLLDFEVA